MKLVKIKSLEYAREHEYFSAKLQPVDTIEMFGKLGYKTSKHHPYFPDFVLVCKEDDDLLSDGYWFHINCLEEWNNKMTFNEGRGLGNG